LFIFGWDHEKQTLFEENIVRGYITKGFHCILAEVNKTVKSII